MTYLVQKKPELEELLLHSGVKGMKWGVRRRKVSTAEIHDARMRQDTRLRTFMDARGKSSDPNATAKARAGAKVRAKTAERDFDTNEDRVTAHRFTRGEKALVGLGIVLSGPAAPVVAIGAIGGKSIANHIVKRSVAKARKRA